MRDPLPGPVDTLVPAVDFPAETLRLVAEQRDMLRSEGKVWADFYAARVRRQVENRSFQGLIWTGPGDEAVALAGWETSGRLGRRGWVYLSEGYQRRSLLEEFLRRVESSPISALPFLSWADDGIGISEADRNVVFSGRGFVPVVRADMRIPREIELPRLPPVPGYTPRPLTLADEPLIADLLFRVYANSPERGLFATTLDEREDARHGVHDLLHGEVGRWLPDASYGIERDGRLVAHTLANELEGGLIAEVGVDPRHRRKGLARRLLCLTVEALRSNGFGAPRLVVTLWNSGAVRLYQSMGFEFVPGGAGRVWLNLKALGVEPPAGAGP
jgi:ribosomal protein S18 acetylase RimI-like enzyme